MTTTINPNDHIDNVSATTENDTKVKTSRKPRYSEKPFERDGEVVKGITVVIPADFEFGQGWKLERNQFAKPHLYYEYMAKRSMWKVEAKREKMEAELAKYADEMAEKSAEYLKTAKDAERHPENYGGSGMTKAALKDMLGVMYNIVLKNYIAAGMSEAEAEAKIEADMIAESETENS